VRIGRSTRRRWWLGRAAGRGTRARRRRRVATTIQPAASRGVGCPGGEFDGDVDVVPAFECADDLVSDVGVDVLGERLVTEPYIVALG
jgi:hypothetical protein